MKVVIDNNIAVDAIAPNMDFEADALKIFGLASSAKIKGYVCANSLTDIFYVVRKTRGANFAKEKIKGLMSFTTTVPLTERDCIDALELPMSDFEDAVVAVCADKGGADYIVTRDEKFLKSASPVAVIAPRELIEILA